MAGMRGWPTARLASAIICLLASESGAGVLTAWKSTYIETDTGIGRAIAPANDGSVYVAVESWGVASSSYDIVTIKYDEEGNKLWDRRHNVLAASMDRPRALALDPSGFLFVTGSTSASNTQSYVTLKYTPAGVFVWRRLYEGGDPLGMRTDAEGNVYITGSGGTIKYNASGDLLWVGLPGIQLHLLQDNTLLVLQSGAIHRLSATGQLIWTKHHTDSASYSIEATGMAVDGWGNSHVTGLSRNASNDYQYATVKNDPLGNPVWVGIFDQPGIHDKASGVAVDSLGNVTVTGTEGTVQYAPDGAERWHRPEVGPVSAAPSPLIDTDADGNTYLALNTRPIPPTAVLGFTTLSYSPLGDLRWLRHEFGTNQLHALSLDHSGSVCVTGNSDGGQTALDALTVKYLQVDCSDSDADTWCDIQDNCTFAHNPFQFDIDGDGIGDDCDLCTDTDGDGAADPAYSASTCPLDNCPNIANPDQADLDGDGIGDLCDPCMDTDGDSWGDPGYAGNTCPEDNCPSVFNPNQEDTDRDGLGDACDDCTDSDGDGFGFPESPVSACPPDNCPGFYNPDQQGCDHHGDPVPDGLINAADLTLAIDIQFAGQPSPIDPGCAHAPVGRTDVNCDGRLTVLDIIQLIDVVFRGAIHETCNPCDCDCYPHGCNSLDELVNLLPHNGSFERFCHSSLDGWKLTNPDYVTLHEQAAPGGGKWSIALHGFWGASGRVQAVIFDPLPGGIYRLSGHFVAGQPYAFSRVSGWVSLRQGSSNRVLNLFSRLSWEQFELVDTLPADGSGPLILELGGDASQFPGLAVFDRVTLQLIGQ